MVNADKPSQWKDDIAASVDHYNAWFMKFAPKTYREKRAEVTQHVEDALEKSKDLTDIGTATLRGNPGILPTLRMCCCPPIARERLAGLASVKKTLVERLEEGSLPARAKESLIGECLGRIVKVIADLLDSDLFPWL